MFHQNHVAFLHEEFLKLPAFPRKALETEFDMYQGQLGKVRTKERFELVYCKC